MHKIYNDYKYVALGIIGALIILYGHLLHVSPQIFYIIGSLILLCTAIHYKLIYFIALELILAAGHSAILLGSGPHTQLALPILLSFQLLIFYLMMGKEKNIFIVVGIVGIALLSLGFSYHNQWIFFTGSLSIATYSYYSAYQDHRIAYLWAILNTLFAIISLVKLLGY